MRTMVVDPGFNYSTMTVAEGFHNAFLELGFEVMEYDTCGAFNLLQDSFRKNNLTWNHITELISASILNEVIQWDIQFVLVIHGWHINPSIVHSLRKIGCKTGVYLTDEPQQVDASKEWSQFYDYVFTNDRNTLGRHKNSYFVPTAADPKIFYPRYVEDKYQSDILVAGSWYVERLKYLDNPIFTELFDKYNTKFVGARKIGFKEGDRRNDWFVDDKVDIKEMSKYTAGAKIIIDIPRNEYMCGIFREANTERIPASNLAPRIYECGLSKTVCLTTGNRRDIFDLYEDMVYPIYGDELSLCQIIEELLEDKEQRVKIAEQCYDITVKNHTYINRVKAVINAVGLIPTQRVVRSTQKNNQQVNQAWEKSWIQNIKEIEEAGLYIEENSLFTLKGKHKNEIALIVGNSPSLEDSLAALKNISFMDTRKIIAVNEAIPLLLEEGINIHYGVIIHPEESVFERSVLPLPPSIDMVLTASSVAHYKAVQGWVERGGKVKFFHTSADGEKKRIVDKIDYPVLGARSSVAYNALTVAEYLGFEEIGIMGLDFCYINNKKYAYQDFTFSSLATNCIELVPDRKNRPVMTDGVMLATLEGVKGFIKNTPHVKYSVHGDGLLYGDLGNLEHVG